MPLPGFDWSDLVFFLELARQGRLVPAARKLRADHTTVSRRVAELERGLNCKLFDRGANGFVLTEAGQRLLAYAESMEASANAIEENVGGVASVPGTGFGMSPYFRLCFAYSTEMMEDACNRIARAVAQLS